MKFIRYFTVKFEFDLCKNQSTLPHATSLHLRNTYFETWNYHYGLSYLNKFAFDFKLKNTLSKNLILELLETKNKRVKVKYLPTCKLHNIMIFTCWECRVKMYTLHLLWSLKIRTQGTNTCAYMNLHYHLIEERQSENFQIYGMEEKIMGAKSKPLTKTFSPER